MELDVTNEIKALFIRFQFRNESFLLYPVYEQLFFLIFTVKEYYKIRSFFLKVEKEKCIIKYRKSAVAS